MASQSPSVLDLSNAPEDAIERIFWLDGVLAKVAGELDEQYAEAYFTARMEGRFDTALRVGRMSKTRALRLTRRVNRASGKAIRWSDGLDPTSTGYSAQ